MASKKLKIGIFLGSTREHRMCDRVCAFVKREVEKTHEAVIFEPLNLDFPQTQQSMNWFMNPSAVPANIRELNDRVASCDALVVLACEYNWSVPPALANIVDNVPPATFIWKPCYIVSYSMGTIAGWRGALQVRQMMGCVGCTIVSKQTGIPVVHEALDADGKPGNEKLTEELNKGLGQLYWLTKAINAQKAIEAPPPFSM